MYRVVGLALAVMICAFVQISPVVADEPTVSPQWAEHFYYSPEWQSEYVGWDADFYVSLCDQSYYPIENALIQFNVLEGPHVGTRGSARTDYSGYAYLSYTGVKTGYDKVLVWYDKVEDGAWSWSEEPGGFAYVYWYVGPTYYFYLWWYGTPIIGNTIYLQAYLGDSIGYGVSGVLIRFEVFDGPNKGVSGSDYTDYWGSAEFSYDGTGGLGEDDVLAYADFDEDGVWDWQEGEPGDFVNIEWKLPYLWVDPYAASPPVGNEMYVEAHVEEWWWYSAGDAQSTSVMQNGTWFITFEIISGPNAGLKQTVPTDEAGIATFKYVGNVVGEDVIKVYYEEYPDWDYRLVYVYWMERLKFTKYELVSSQWQPPYYIAELRPYITNPTIVPVGLYSWYFTAYNVTAVISEVPPWTEIIDGEVSFVGSGGIEPGETVPSDDTFKIKVNTKKVKDPKQGIKWTVMYYDPWWNLHVIANVQQK